MPLSYSKLQLYRTCPRKYEYACIKKIPRQISAGESFGSSVHNTLKKWGDAEARRKKEEGKSQLALFEDKKKINVSLLTSDFLLTLWHQSFIVEGYASRVEADSARQKGEKLMQHFFKWWNREPRSVLAIERGFKIPTRDTEISGRFDRVEHTEEGIHVIDYKTGKPQSQDQVDTDLQLSIYALAGKQMFHKPCDKLTLLFLYEDELIERTTQRSESQLEDAIKQIHLLYESMEEQDFHPTPSKDICKCCPYNGVCDVAAV